MRPNECLAHARLWRWTARAFWYPDQPFLTELKSPDLRQELNDSAESTTNERIVEALQAAWAAADGIDSELRLAEEHTFLFARKVLVSPHESSYAAAAGPDRTRAMAEVSGFYAAFGYQVSSLQADLPDHVSLECEFVAALLAKQAYAASRGWDSRVRLTSEARERFLGEHLALWFPVFAQRLAQHARLGFYPAAARLGLALLSAQAVELSPRPGNGLVPLEIGGMR